MERQLFSISRLFFLQWRKLISATANWPRNGAINGGHQTVISLATLASECTFFSSFKVNRWLMEIVISFCSVQWKANERIQWPPFLFSFPRFRRWFRRSFFVFISLTPLHGRCLVGQSTNVSILIVVAYWPSPLRDAFTTASIWVWVLFFYMYFFLPSFTWFYWILPGLLGFYWVLSGLLDFYWVYIVLSSFTGFYWVLLGFTGSYWVLLVLLGFWRILYRFRLVLLGFTGFSLGFHWVLPGLLGFYWVNIVLPSLTGFYWVLTGFTWLTGFLLGFT